MPEKQIDAGIETDVFNICIDAIFTKFSNEHTDTVMVRTEDYFVYIAKRTKENDRTKNTDIHGSD